MDDPLGYFAKLLEVLRNDTFEQGMCKYLYLQVAIAVCHIGHRLIKNMMIKKSLLVFSCNYVAVFYRF